MDPGTEDQECSVLKRAERIRPAPQAVPPNPISRASVFSEALWFVLFVFFVSFVFSW